MKHIRGGNDWKDLLSKDLYNFRKNGVLKAVTDSDAFVSCVVQCKIQGLARRDCGGGGRLEKENACKPNTDTINNAPGDVLQGQQLSQGPFPVQHRCKIFTQGQEHSVSECDCGMYDVS